MPLLVDCGRPLLFGILVSLDFEDFLGRVLYCCYQALNAIFTESSAKEASLLFRDVRHRCRCARSIQSPTLVAPYLRLRKLHLDLLFDVQVNDVFSFICSRIDILI